MLITLQQLLNADEVAQFRQQLASARWQHGALTAGELAQQVKQNEQVDDSDPLARALGEHIRQRLLGDPRFIAAALPRRIYPPKFNRYADGGHYGIHVDSALFSLADGGRLRSDLSATLFLAAPESYDGGELHIEGPFGAQAVKLAAGDLVLYPSSSLHQVTPVTRGERLAAFLWIESLVADEGARSLLYDLDQGVQAARLGLPADDPALGRLSAVYHNLLRRWARP